LSDAVRSWPPETWSCGCRRTSSRGTRERTIGRQTMTIPITPTFFDTLQEYIARSGPDLGLSVATEPSPPLCTPLLQMSIPEGTVIPSSLIMILDAAYLFHLLARDPQKVVTPGKSLLSVLAGLNQMVTRTLESSTEKFVRKTAHEAFWDQVSLCLRIC
jgi:hypothetical protein